jgi:hypothetical protein
MERRRKDNTNSLRVTVVQNANDPLSIYRLKSSTHLSLSSKGKRGSSAQGFIAGVAGVEGWQHIENGYPAQHSAARSGRQFLVPPGEPSDGYVLDVVTAVMEYCWLQQNELVPVEDDGQESPCNSWGEAMARTFWIVGLATSMPFDTCEFPARACARSAQSDNLHGIDEATMQCIVKDLQSTVQTFFTGRPEYF